MDGSAAVELQEHVVNWQKIKNKVCEKITNKN